MPPSTRCRLVIDPVWKVVDTEEYNRLWQRFTHEADVYGFVGFDMEWTTRTIIAAAATGVEGDEEGSSTSSKPRPRRWTGPVATIQLSTYSCTLVIKWSHLHALVSGNASEALRDPYAPLSSRWPHHREGLRRNSRVLLRTIYRDVKDLIKNPRIFKVGVGIHGDEVKLRRDYPKVIMESAVDLVALAVACLPDVVPDRRGHLPPSAAVPLPSVRTDSLQSLKKLRGALIGRELEKDMSVVLSDWGACHGALTPAQAEYSAEDAEASYDICVAILCGGGLLHDTVLDKEKGSEQQSSPPWHAVKDLDCREVLACCTTERKRECEAGSSVASMAAPTQPRVRTTAAPSGANGADIAIHGEAADEQDWCKGRVKPYYDNISVYGPDRHLLFTVDKAKADWYVNKKGLAQVIKWGAAVDGARGADTNSNEARATEPREMAAIQLAFAPNFARFNDAHIRRNMEYFKQPKENICVVCGEGSSLVRFAVVPLMYRRFFPSVYMSHNSYDLLLLCPRCFSKSRHLYDELRRQVAEDFGVPLVHLRANQRHGYAAAVREIQRTVEVQMSIYEDEKKRRRALEEGHAMEKDCDLSPRLKLQGMSEYLALMEHREVLDRIFSFAKALHHHYVSSASAPAAEEEASADDERRSGNTSAVSTGSAPKRNKRKSGTGKVAQIPEERRRIMAACIAAHAPLYPFAGTDVSQKESHHGSPLTVDARTVQEEVFDAAEGGPASLPGVRLILTGRVGDTPTAADTATPLKEAADPVQKEDTTDGATLWGNTCRRVLTRFWLARHPALLTLLPVLTRAEEHGRRTSVAAADEEEERFSELPHVDSHAFTVVRMLLEKYKDDNSGSKTEEHAVGQFIYRWRSAFVAGMQPQYLPRGWLPEDGILR